MATAVWNVWNQIGCFLETVVAKILTCWLLAFMLVPSYTKKL